jgi:hypothetical protein
MSQPISRRPSRITVTSRAITPMHRAARLVLSRRKSPSARHAALRPAHERLRIWRPFRTTLDRASQLLTSRGSEAAASSQHRTD